MLNTQTDQKINDLLGSAVVFATAINDLMAKQLEQVSDGRVTFVQLKVLKLLALKGRLSVTDVANFMDISTAAASKGIDRLVRQKMLKRAAARRDRRALRVSLTDNARAILERYDATTSDTLGDIFGGFTSRQLTQLTNSLDKLSISVVHHEEDAEDSCFRCGIYFRDKCLLRGMFNRTCYMDLREQADPQAAKADTPTGEKPPT